MADTTLIAGGAFRPSLAFVSTDGVTVLGDGTTENPIRLASGDGGRSIRGILPGASVADLGSPVYLLVGSATLAKATSATTRIAATAIGVVAEILDATTGEVRIATDGQVELSAAQWNSIAGGSGGLTVGAAYHVTTTPGHLSTGTLGDFTSQVGVARSSTVLILSTPAQPEEI